MNKLSGKKRVLIWLYIHKSMRPGSTWILSVKDASKHEGGTKTAPVFNSLKQLYISLRMHAAKKNSCLSCCRDQMLVLDS